MAKAAPTIPNLRAIGSGTPLLVVHGGPGADHTYLRPWLDPLADTFRVVFFDLPSCGCADGGADGLSWDAWVAALEDCRSALDAERVVVFGHSAGGMLALDYALRYASRIAGLVLCAAAASLGDPDAIARRFAARADASQVESFGAVLARPRLTDAEFAELWLHILPVYFHGALPEAFRLRFGKTCFRAAPFDYWKKEVAPAWDRRPQLGCIRCPTLVLSGAHDFLFPAAIAGQELAAGIPGAELVALDASGHMPFVEQQVETLASVRAWWRRHAAH